MKTMNRQPRRDCGMSLIEVLVALLIFSFGLLGFVGLQARAIQYSVSAENSNRAALLANEIATTIQLKGSPFTKATDSDIAAWNERVGAITGIPGATATVDYNTASKAATITITWQSSGMPTTSKDQYVTQVVVP